MSKYCIELTQIFIYLNTHGPILHTDQTLGQNFHKKYEQRPFYNSPVHVSIPTIYTLFTCIATCDIVFLIVCMVTVYLMYLVSSNN